MTNSTPRIERIRDFPGMYKPTGPFSAVVRLGDLLLLSGIRGIDENTQQPIEGDERQRIRKMFENLKFALEASGSDCAHVLVSRVYVTDMVRHRPLINEMYEEFFGEHLPTRTIVEVKGLNQQDIAEIEVVALRAQRD